MPVFAYGREAYGGSVLGRRGDVTRGRAVPGYTDFRFFWSSGGASNAYGDFTYGGASASVFPSAGLFASADPASASVTVPIWWSYASQVVLSRVDALTGERTPVRGGAPYVLTGDSASNLTLNPKAAIDTAGMSAAANTTLSRITGLTTPSPYVTTGYRGTATAAGAVTLTASVDAVLAEPTTYAFFVRTSALASAIALSVAWFDNTSTLLSTQTYAISDSARTGAVGSWSRATVGVRPVVNAVVGVLSYVASGLPAAGTFDVTGRITRRGIALPVGRTNLQVNPSMEDASGGPNLTGYAVLTRSGVSATAIDSSRTITPPSGNLYAYTSSTGDGTATSSSFDVVVRAPATAIATGVTYRVGAALATNASTANVAFGRVGVDWLDATGTQLTTNGSVTGSYQALTSAGFSDVAMNVTPPTGAAGMRVTLWFYTTRTTATSFRFDAVSVEDASKWTGGYIDSLGNGYGYPADPIDYFDGDYPGGSWRATSGASISDVSDIEVITDAEAPFDRAVYYELSSGTTPGYVAVSQTVTLSSAGNKNFPRDSMLTHPGLNVSVPVQIEAEMDIGRKLAQSTFKVIGRKNPVVISDSQRQGDTGSITFIAETYEERDRLLTMLADGSPMLLRTPAAHGHPPIWWLSFSDLSVSALSGYAVNPLRKIKADFVQVDRPSAATRPLVI